MTPREPLSECVSSLCKEHAETHHYRCERCDRVWCGWWTESGPAYGEPRICPDCVTGPDTTAPNDPNRGARPRTTTEGTNR